jgi:hypothetical protein
MRIPGSLAAFLATVAFTQICSSRLSAQSGDSTYITAEKGEQFDQTAASATVADPVSPYSFDTECPVAMNLTPPGESTITLSNQNSNKYDYNQSFTSLAALNSAFPDGNYTFAVSGSSSFTLGLTGDSYPNTPEVTNGTWNTSGQLVLDSTQSNTIDLNTFTAYGTVGAASHMQIQIQSPDGTTVDIDQSYVTPTNASPFTSYAIAAGALSAGSFYQAQLEFDTVPNLNSTAVSGDTAVTVYGVQTSFSIVTSGTPSSPPTITQQPTNQTEPLGSNVTFNVQFNGGNNTSTYWFKNGIQINQNNQNGANLTLNGIQNSDAASYFAILANGNGAYVQSNTVTLTIGTSTTSAPSFEIQPQSQIIASGSTVVFHANASGSPTPSYQWYYNGSILANGNGVSGATGATLVINGATSANAGNYYCVVSNSSGQIQSNTASLSSVTTNNPGRLINISCRSQVGTGGDILIAGFVVGGAGTSGGEAVLIRGSGPALVPFGVTGTLPDPQLQLYSGSTLLATNDGWGSNAAAISAAASAVGAFPWNNTSSHDSALLEASLDGAYTAQIAGQSGDTGVALAEVYDDTPAGTYTPATPRLINISARVQVGTGGNILIAGFVIGGSTSKSVLIRASGPALVPFGVTGTLPDPELELYSGSTLLGTNTGWGGDPEIANAAASVGAFPWTNTSSDDSAILVTLPPGAYTAQVSGASGDTGVSLVEVYDYP